MVVSSLQVYETYGAGACESIAFWSGEGGGGGGGGEGGGSGWDVVWTGEAERGLPKEARLFAPPLEPRSYATQFARLEFSVEGPAQVRCPGDQRLERAPPHALACGCRPLTRTAARRLPRRSTLSAPSVRARRPRR